MTFSPDILLFFRVSNTFLPIQLYPHKRIHGWHILCQNCCNPWFDLYGMIYLLENFTFHQEEATLPHHMALWNQKCWFYASQIPFIILAYLVARWWHWLSISLRTIPLVRHLFQRYNLRLSLKFNCSLGDSNMMGSSGSSIADCRLWIGTADCGCINLLV